MIMILESIFIHKLSPNLNNQTSACPLNILNWYIYFLNYYLIMFIL